MERELRYVPYTSEEEQLPLFRTLIDRDLSEPYSIYTYRYFLNNWPQLTFLAMDGEECVGVIVSRLEQHKTAYRGYIAMLAVAKSHRKRGIGSHLVKMVLRKMKESMADEVVMEAEETNRGALSLYENLGFVRDKKLHHYYLSGSSAYRLKLWFREPPQIQQ